MISTILHWTCDPISASMASLLFRRKHEFAEGGDVDIKVECPTFDVVS